MKQFFVLLVIFLVVNFGSLYVGNLLQGAGPFSEWYQGLNIAPWTPPGWVFGAAWSLIMFCFSIYMATLFRQVTISQLAPWFGLQVIFNIAWNPTFFRYHHTIAAMVVLIGLTIVVGVIAWKFSSEMSWKSILLAPYLIWLLIALSLNGYVILNN